MHASGLAHDGRFVAPSAAEEMCGVLPAPAHHGARFLFDHWRERHLTGGFIVGIHVPSRELSTVLPGIALHEPVDGGRDYRVRLAGTSLRRRFGRDITGLTLSDLFDTRRFAYYRTLMRRVHRLAEPFVLDLKIVHDDLVRQHFELVGMQVFSPDCRCPWIMTGQFHYTI